MKMTNYSSISFRALGLSCLIFFFLLGCTGSSKPDPLMEEAFRIHQQSMQIVKEIKEILKKLPAGDDSVLKIESRLMSWNENLIEVPGFEHDHNHEHHHHKHGSQIELSPENMLAVQKVLLDSVIVIRKELENLQF
ncbi:MAG: hypothetical protein ACRBF0_25415 [Calditrichia bacterium]